LPCRVARGPLSSGAIRPERKGPRRSGAGLPLPRERRLSREIQGQRIPMHLQLTTADSRRLKQPPGGGDLVSLGVLVRKVDHLRDSRLDYHLRTFVAGEEGHIEAAVVEVGGDLVDYRVELGVADILLFSIQVVAFPRPRELVV
jgi:hypothetical protein